MPGETSMCVRGHLLGSCCVCSGVVFLPPDLPFDWSPQFPASSVTTSCGIQMQTVRWPRAHRSWLTVVKERRKDT